MKGYRQKKSKAIPVLLTICFVLCGILAFLLIIYNRYKTEEIRVEGLSSYERDEFLDKISDASMRKNTAVFRLKDRFEHKKDIPYIEDYEVSTEGNNCIVIRVYEKILIGCVNVMGEYLYFDKDGLVTEISSEHNGQVPIVKGLIFDRIILNEKLVIQKQELYQRILNLTKLIREYKIPVKTVTFNSRDEVELETEKLVLLLGKRESYDLQIQKIAEILPSLDDRRLRIDMSDYRGGSVDIIAKPVAE